MEELNTFILTIINLVDIYTFKVVVTNDSYERIMYYAEDKTEWQILAALGLDMAVYRIIKVEAVGKITVLEIK